ncbi:MAG: ATP-binding protein, partial [Pseudomonadota bacterium]
DATESMQYLWDLLDLATADNIAVHIANHLYAREEEFFQLQLAEPDAAPPSISPTYNPKQIIERCLAGADIENLSLTLDDVEPLLGNPNHLRLVLENLLNNAAYYAERARYKNRHAKIAVGLQQKAGRVRLSIYNHGPTVDEENREKLFQLGFSTRQVSDHHGKGLGLHFVSEIVQGYEGDLSFQNIEGREDSASIRITTANGEVETHLVHFRFDGERLGCSTVNGGEEIHRQCEWRFSSSIQAVEVVTESDGARVQQLIDADSQILLLDRANPEYARWSLDIRNRKRSAKLTFQVLDITGVRFAASLPTARSRLDYEDDFLEPADNE